MNVFFQIGRFLTFVALFGMFELHWAGLQSIAWVQMIYSDLEQVDEAAAEEEALMEIVMRNISGDEKCDMCRSIMKEMSQEQEEKRDAGTNRRVELVPSNVGTLTVWPPQTRRLRVSMNEARADSWRTEPVSPPPQLS